MEKTKKPTTAISFGLDSLAAPARMPSNGMNVAMGVPG